MIMSVHDPIARKRSLGGPGPTEGAVNKKFKSENKEAPEDAAANNNIFSEKMYSAYVKSALDSLDKNDPVPTNSLTSKISLPLNHKDAISLVHMNIILNGLISNIAKLDNKSCHGLIGSVLEYKWLDIRNKETLEYSRFTELYSRFISVLVSSFPKYLHDVTKKLVGEFNRIAEIPNNQFHHHQVLSKIIKFIPTCINSLPQTLQKHFPHHMSSSSSELTNYVSNLMKIVTYCPDLQFNIWQLIIECCIKLDVELQNELDDLDDDEIDELINGKEEEEDSDDDNDDDSDEEGDNEAVNKEDSDQKKIEEDTIVVDDVDDDMDGEMEYLIEPMTSTANIKKLLSKLDSIMNLLLINTTNSFTSDELNNGNGVSLFNTITSLFRSHILPTHFTKSIQFVLFHISQYQSELADSYLVLLIDVAFNVNEILEKRLKAMQYLSSYIARAKNLSRHQIVFIVSYLIGWLNKYILERECEIHDFDQDTNNLNIHNEKPSGGMERFKLFYAAFQALLYIFCFRHKLLYKSTENHASSEQSSTDSEWECELDKFFQRVILAKFNPLKFCDETVVYIFAKIATKLNVCYCYSIIEHNKRERMLQTNGNSVLPSAVGNFKQKQEFLDLEGYFPFDPLVLPTCKAIIAKNYVEWSEVNPSSEDGEDDEDSGSHREDDEDEDEDASDSDEDITSDEED